MKLREIMAGIEITRTTADPETEIGGISYDSRSTVPGDVFVAVRGYESDGHRYVASAVEKGAVCVVCEDETGITVPYVKMSDSRRALAVMSANLFGRPADKLKVIGVTGTNGKTTTTMLVKESLERITGEKVGLLGTIQNMIGTEVIDTERTTPESYELQKLFARMLSEGCRYAVMEVSSHALYLDRVYGFEFESAAFTNLTQDHLDFHKTIEEYAKAKAILFSRCRHAVINIDDAHAGLMTKSAGSVPVITYAVRDDSASLRAENMVFRADSVEFDAVTDNKRTHLRLGIPGEFSVYNALTALGILLSLGVKLETAAEAVGAAKGVKGRAEVVPTGRDFTVLIDYAHTPDALENIIKTVRGVARGRVITLCGCGGDRDRTKRPIMGEIATRLSDLAVITSDNPRTEEPEAIIRDILAGIPEDRDNYKVITDRREAIGWAIENALPDDVVILAGKGHETYQIVGREKRHFDEREVVAEYLSE